jgi:peptide/nickel transport system substrate-binding protein
MMHAIDRRTALSLLGGAAGLMAATPATAQTGQAPRRGGTLNVGFSDDSRTLDPIMSIQWSERQMLYLLYNTLLRMRPDFSLEPELAERWSIENNGTRIVFQLRGGVKFHDGTDFNAEAVKWNLERRMDRAVNSPQRSQLEVITSIEVLGPLSIALNTATPFAPLLGHLSERPGFMVSPTAAEKHGQDFGSNPVGTGPFVLRSWTRGSRIVLERNPAYWEPGLPYLDQIIFSDIAGAVVGIQRLVTGELDYIDSLSPQNIRQIESNRDIKLDPITVGRWYSYQWHWNAPPFNNAKLRAAIAHAIDRNRINAITMMGRAVISDSPTPAGLWWHTANLQGFAHDPARARALLAEAGVAAGTRIELSAPTDPILRQMNQLVQEQLKAVGLEVELKPIAQGEWYSRVVQRAINFTPMRWTQRPDPDGLLSILFHSKGFANSTGYANPEVDRLLEQARGIFDQAERKPLYDRIHQLILQDLPYVPVYFSAEYAAMRQNVMNFQWIPDQIPRFLKVWKA